MANPAHVHLTLLGPCPDQITSQHVHKVLTGEGTPTSTAAQKATLQKEEGRISCKVAVEVGVGGVTLQVVALYQVLNAFLDDAELWLEHAGQLLHHLHHQLHSHTASQ